MVCECYGVWCYGVAAVGGYGGRSECGMKERKRHNYRGIVEKEETILSIDYGSYFGGECEITILKYDENYYHMIADGGNGFEVYWDFIFYEEEILGLLDCIINLPKWERQYKSEEKVLDGYTWGIHFKFEDIKVFSCGYAKVPNDYYENMEKIIRELEKLADNYVEEGNKKLLPARTLDAVYVSEKR